MRNLKRWMAALLCAVLLLGLLPTAALAADADWAQSAVTTLNGIYGSGVFSADDSTMKEKDVGEIVSAAKWSTDVSLDNGEDILLTRGTACEVLADVFALPIGNQTAIRYLYDQNIINGVSESNLNEEGNVSFAEFAVLTYRVLNFVGGGMGTEANWPAPGSKGYIAWMYLAVRKCVPFEMSQASTLIKNVSNFETYDSVSDQPKQWRPQIDGSTNPVYNVETQKASDEGIWNAWAAALREPKLGGNASFIAPTYNPDETLLNAAIRMVEARNDANPVIFHDVTAGNWFYDGIMYLVNNNIVIGYGDGQFGANDLAPRYEFAVLLTNMEGVTLSTESGPGRIIEAIQYVVGKGYMTGTTSEEVGWDPTTDAYWSQPTTREEATVGILKMIQATKNIDTSSDNLAILDRFTDREQITSEASKPYLAYAVSMGLLSGTSENTLSPTGSVSRAQAGVLLYRTLIGVDKTKMKDYTDNVDYAKKATTATESALLHLAPLEETGTTLTLREDWRLTSDLDLKVPEGTTLTINGQGKYHIYEMGGMMRNSGSGTVNFKEGTILYPAGESGSCTAETSNKLLAAHAVTIAATANGTVTSNVTTAKRGDTVTLTVTPASGYQLSTLTVTTATNQPVTVSSNTFTMPGEAVTVTATFTPKPVDPGTGSGGGGGGGTSSSTTTETTKNPDGSTTTTTTNQVTGTVTETTKYPDGSKSVVETKKDGTVTTTTTDQSGNKTETVENPDGTSQTTLTNKDGSGSVTQVDENGQMETSVKLPAAVVDEAAGKGEAVPLPMPSVPVTADRESASTVTVDLPTGRAVRVEIPVDRVTPGTVAMLVDANGNADVIQTSLTTETGVVVTLRDGDTVRIVDNTKTFNDVPNTHWGADAVAFAASRELFTGTGPDTFAPETATSRAMIVTVLARLNGVDTSVGDTWYEAGQKWAMEAGISDGTNMEQSLTREQLATMLYRYMGSPAVSTSLSGYTDVDTVSDWAKTAMAWAVENGLITGIGTSLHSQGTATRVQVATILMRFLETMQ